MRPKAPLLVLCVWMLLVPRFACICALSEKGCLFDADDGMLDITVDPSEEPDAIHLAQLQHWLVTLADANDSPLRLELFARRRGPPSAAAHSSTGAAEVGWGGCRQPITLCPNRAKKRRQYGGSKNPVSHFPSDHTTPTQDPI